MNSTQSQADGKPPTRRVQLSRLGDVLCERGLVTAAQLETALQKQKESSPPKPLGQVLVEMELVSAQQVVQALAESVGTPFAILTPEMVRSEALKCLPREVLEQHNLLPLSVAEGWLTIAVEQFTNVFLIEEIGRKASCQVQVIAAEPGNIRETRTIALGGSSVQSAHTAQDAGGSLDGILGQIGADDLKVVEHEPEEEEADLEATAADSPVVKLVNYIIKTAVEMNASDVHIEPDDACFRVRFRVDGELLESVRPTSRLLPAVVSRIKIMAGMDISERRLPQDGGVTVTLVDRSADLRVSTMATKFGEKVVMRIVDRLAAVRTLDSLGFETQMLKRFRAVVHESTGIVLVTGPTGSGKTTTLYGALAELISTKHNISTIEDPVERRLSGTNQFQVHAQAGFTFANALRSLLRQDPDIIMVGEIRDAETARLATEAALTGHLVLSTLHTNDAFTAVPRLVNMGVEPYLVAASLRGVLAQRLVRRLCTHCRKSIRPSSTERELLAQLNGGADPIESVSIGAGCPSCRQSGCAGRIGIYELLLLNEDILSAIARDPSMNDFRAQVRRQQWTSLLQDGLDKLKRGLINVDALMEIAPRTEESSNMAAQLPRVAA